MSKRVLDTHAYRPSIAPVGQRPSGPSATPPRAASTRVAAPSTTGSSLRNPTRTLAPTPAPDATVRVGVGDFGIVRGAGKVITFGLGSCVALAWWDAQAQLACLLHAVLPTSENHDAASLASPFRFVDTGLERALREFTAKGGSAARSRFGLFGAASMPGMPARFNVGARNLLSLRKLAWRYNLRIVADETEGSISRTLTLFSPNGVAVVSSPGLPNRSFQL